MNPSRDGKQLQGKRNITVRVPFNLSRNMAVSAILAT